MGLLRFFRDLYRRWYRDDTGLLAAAVAYYGAMSLFPLLLVLTSGLGAFLKWTNTGKDARQWVLNAVAEQLSPALSQNIEQALAHVQNYAGFGGPVGAITLLLTALAIFAQFERAFDRIWNVPAQGTTSLLSSCGQLLKYRMRAFAMLVGLGIAVVLVFASGWAFTAFQSRIAARFQTSPWVWRAMDILLQVSLNALVFAALYRLLPKRPVTWRQAWAGGLFAALVWEIGRQVLAQFIIGQRYTSAYGVIGTLLAIMIWGYYGIAVVLVGAQLVSLLVERGLLNSGVRLGLNSGRITPQASEGERLIRPQPAAGASRAHDAGSTATPVGMAAHLIKAAGGSSTGPSTEDTTSPVRVRRPILHPLGGGSSRESRGKFGLGWLPEIAFAAILLYLGSFLAIRQWGTRPLSADAENSSPRQVIFSRHPAAHRIARAAYAPLIKILPGAYQYPASAEFTDSMSAAAPEENISDATSTASAAAFLQR